MTKKITAIILSFIILAIASDISAAEMHNCRNQEWKQKIMSEKIAFLTIEMNISPEEAQIFWPVYNQIWEEKDQAMMSIFKAFRELEQAVKDGKSGKELEKLTDVYLSAKDKQREIDSKAAEAFKAVLPAEKVARLYIGEEKFRRQQIHKLHGKPNGKPE